MQKAASDAAAPPVPQASAEDNEEDRGQQRGEGPRAQPITSLWTNWAPLIDQ